MRVLAETLMAKCYFHPMVCLRDLTGENQVCVSSSITRCEDPAGWDAEPPVQRWRQHVSTAIAASASEQQYHTVPSKEWVII